MVVTNHIMTTHRPHTNHILTRSTYSLDHIPTTYWPHTNHTLTYKHQPYIDQINLFTITMVVTKHTPTTYQPHTDHTPTTYQPHSVPTHTNHILTTDINLFIIPTTHRPHTNHIPTVLLTTHWPNQVVHYYHGFHFFPSHKEKRYSNEQLINMAVEHWPFNWVKRLKNMKDSIVNQLVCPLLCIVNIIELIIEPVQW